MSLYLDEGWSSDATPARRGQAGRTPTTATSTGSRARSRSHADQGFSFDDDKGPITRKPSFVDESTNSPVTRKPSFANGSDGTPMSRKPSFMSDHDITPRPQHNDYDAEIDAVIDEEVETPLLVFKELSASTWNNQPILENISGILCEGQIMGVMGLYGSGKTTFLHGLIATSDDNVGRGSRTYHGDTFSTPNLRVGYVGHDSTLLEHLKVEDTIRYAIALDCPGLDNARVEKRMERWVTKLDLTHVMDQPMSVLSTGQRRRVGLVLVLVRACNLMIMDEPLTGLDSYTAVEIMREIRNIADTEKISVVVSLSQLKEDIFQYLDLSLVLHEGRTAYFGPARDTMGELIKLTGAKYMDFSAKLGVKTPDASEGNAAGGSSLSPVAIPPPYKLHDFLFAHRHHVEESKKQNSQVLSIPDEFAKSKLNSVLMDNITHALTEPNSQLEPYKIADRTWATKGLFWRRARLGTFRFLTDMWHDKTAWLSLVFLPILMVAATSAVFFNQGVEVSLNFPMAQGAFLFALASLIILQVQLTIPRCCRLYQIFRQAHIDGTQSTWQFVAEAVFCTFGFAVFYGSLTVIASFFCMNDANIHHMTIINAIILAISSQIIVWASVFASNGNVIGTVILNAVVQLICLGCDGFVIPFGHIRPPYVLFFFINPRSWFMHASMVDLMCGEGPCESLPFSNDVLFSSEVDSLREKILYAHGSDVITYDEVNEYLESLIIDYFDLDVYTTVECTAYAFTILVAAGALAIGILHGALWLFYQAHQGVEDRILHFLTKYNIDMRTAAHAISAFVVFVMLLSASLVADHLQDSKSSSSSKVVRYDPLMPKVCSECFGVPSVKDLLASTEDIYDTSLFIQRLDITTRALLSRVPAINDLCAEQNFFKPTGRRLQVNSLQQIFDDYFPRNYVEYIEDRDDFINLVHAEGRLARWWMDIASADVLQLITSLNDPQLGDFPISNTDALNYDLHDYFLDTYGMSLADAAAEQRLYVFTRVPGLDQLDANFIDNDHLQLNPHALFFRNSTDSDLHTIAIQLKGSGEADILFPSAGYDWPAAKAVVRHAMFLRGVIEHFVRCHHVVAAIGVATENTLDHSHPLREILFLATEPQLYAQVIGTIRQALVPIQNLTAAMQLELVRAYDDEVMYYRDIPYDVHSQYRGVWDLNDGLYSPLRPLLHEYWEEVVEYCNDLVDYMYASDEEMVRDRQLMRWKDLVQAPNGGNIRDLFPPSNTCGLCTKADLSDLLASLIFTGMRHSTSLIVEYSSAAMYYPFMASNIRISRLPGDSSQPFTEGEFLDMFSDSAGILDHITFFNIGLTLVQRRLDQWPSRMADPSLKDLAQNFVDKMISIARDHGDALDVNIAPRIEGFPQW